MKNDLSWLDELPDYGAATPPEKNPVFFNVEGYTHHGYEYQPEISHLTPEQRLADLKAFLLAGVTDDAEAHARLKQNAELEGLNARRGKMDALNSRAVAGQTIMRYAYPELGPEPGAYFLSRNKPLPECHTRTEAYGAVYDDYMVKVESEYNELQKQKTKQRQQEQQEEARKEKIIQIEQARIAEQTAQEAAHQKIQQSAIIAAITLSAIIIIYLKRKYICQKLQILLARLSDTDTKIRILIYTIQTCIFIYMCILIYNLCT